MIIIFRKADGVVIGEHADDSKAEELAEQYGATFGLRVIDEELNRAWLEKTISIKTHETVWREWLDTLWRKADGETRRVATAPGEEWQMVLAGHYAGERIGGPAPGPQWAKVQEEQWAEQTIRAGVLSVNPHTKTIHLDGMAQTLAETIEAIDLETAAAIRSAYPLAQELKLIRMGRNNPNHPEVELFDSNVGDLVDAGQERKAFVGGKR